MIVDVEASRAIRQAEVGAARTMIARTQDRFGLWPERLAADTGYGSAEMLAWLVHDQGIEPHIPVIDRTAQTGGKLSRAEFTYDPAADVFTCPEGRVLRHRGYEPRTATHRYYARPGDCRICPRKPDCTDARARRVLRMVDEDARDRARVLQDTPEFARSRRLRRRIERLFGHLKRSMGLRRLKLRGLRGAAEEFAMAAAAQNLILLTGRRSTT